MRRFSLWIQASGMHCISGMPFNNSAVFKQSDQSGIRQFVEQSKCAFAGFVCRQQLEVK